MTAAEQRALRAAELQEASARAIDHAKALELLAARIDQHALPVERWRPYWAEVAHDCRRSARNLRHTANLDTEHARLIEAADEARLEHQRGTR